MNKFLANFVLISSALILSVSFVLYLSQTSPFSPNKPDKKDSPLIYSDEADNPKYSQGACSQNSDCQPAGCSSHICSSTLDLVTTCEIKADFPDKNIYSCGCIEKACVWYNK